MLKASDPSGRSLNFKYNDDGRIASIKLSDKTTHCTFAYSDKPDYSLTKVTYADGTWESYKYVTVGKSKVLMQERCNSDEVCQFYTYDTLTRATSNYGNDSVNLVELDYRVTVRGSSATGISERIFLTTVKGEDTAVYESKFIGNTGRRKLLRKVTIGNPNKSFEQAYDKDGNKIFSTYNKGHADGLSFDSLSRETYSWTGMDDKGFDTYTMTSYIPSRFNLEDIVRTTWIKTKSTTTTDFEYDRKGNVIGIIEYDIHDLSPESVRKAKLKYTPRGQLQYFHFHSAENGYELKISYYGNGDIKSSEDGESKKFDYGKRDNLGNPTWVKYPNGAESHFEFDKRGRLISVREVNQKGLSEITRCAYNYSGKIIRLTLPDSSFVVYDYDNHSWLMKVHSSDHGTTIYDYNNYGHIIDKQIISPQGDTISTSTYQSRLE